jgi:arylsulfatase A-like enzyme
MLAKQNRSGHAQAIQAYLASITYVDECIGQVLAALDRSGLRQNTIVVLWSDHGWFLGEKLSWQKFKMWERASRVPLVISTPNGPRGNCFSPVSLLDVFPTLAELAHAPIPDAYKRQIDGRSLSSHLANPGAEYSTYAVTTQSIARTGDTGPGQPGPGTDIFHSIRTNRWRYTKYPDFPGAALSEELYDLRNDPGETRNLLFWEPDRHADVRATLAELLRRRTS